MISRYKYLLFFLTGFFCFVFLQVISYLLLRNKISIYKNEKILFFFTPSFLIAIIFLVLALFIIFSLYEIKKEKNIPLIFIPFGLILGGGLSNIFDRLRIGGVADYLDFYFWKMNLADIFIFAGIIILLIIFLKKKS